MIDTTATRLTCSIPGPRNDYGKPKLLATIKSDGIEVWCRYCKCAHLLSRADVIAAWERGESVQCVAPDEQAV